MHEMTANKTHIKDLFLKAFEDGNLSAMRAIGDNNDIDSIDIEYMRFLFPAAESGRLDIVNYIESLIKKKMNQLSYSIWGKGWSWHLASEDGYTFLHAAVRGNNLAIVRKAVEEYRVSLNCCYIEDESGGLNHKDLIAEDTRVTFKVLRTPISLTTNIEILDYLFTKGTQFLISSQTIESERFSWNQNSLELREMYQYQRWTNPPQASLFRSKKNYAAKPVNLLTEAAERGDVRMVTFLLDKGFPIESTDYRGYSPLIRAARSNRQEVATILLARGANVHYKAEACYESTFGMKYSEGCTALYAAACAHPEMVRLLLPYKPDPTIHFKTYSYNLRIYGYRSRPESACRELIRPGFDEKYDHQTMLETIGGGYTESQRCSYTIYTALLSAVYYSHQPTNTVAVEDNPHRESVLEVLYSEDADCIAHLRLDLDERYLNNFSLPYNAITEDELKYYYQITDKLRLFSAARLGDLKKMAEILRPTPRRVYADANSVDEKTGNTALHFVCRHLDVNAQTKLEIIKLLLELGADPSILNKNGETAFEIGVIKPKYSEACNPLIRYVVLFGKDNGLLCELVKHGIIDDGFDGVVNSSLQIAINKRHVDMCITLIAVRLLFLIAKQQIPNPGNDKLTELLKIGAHVDQCDRLKRTPLHIVISKDDEHFDQELAKFLADNGADTEALDFQGKKPGEQDNNALLNYNDSDILTNIPILAMLAKQKNKIKELEILFSMYPQVHQGYSAWKVSQAQVQAPFFSLSRWVDTNKRKREDNGAPDENVPESKESRLCNVM